jgi:ribonuclease HI
MTPSRKIHPPQSRRLFAEPDSPGGVYVAHVDGGARGNPGPAAYGVVVRKPDGSVIESLGKRIGKQTNNVAEYHGLIAALDYATAHGIRRLRVRSDSLLLVQQMRGAYKVKNAALKPLHERATRLSRSLEFFAIEHVRRELNAEADAVYNAVLDASANAELSTRSSAALPPLSKTVRARFADGALYPTEPLSLAPGEEVEITIHRKP